MDKDKSNIDLTTYTAELARTASPLFTPAQFLVNFLKWWYVDAVSNHLRFFTRLVEILVDQLSIGTLLSTFFVPWHRDRNIIGFVFGILMRILWLPLAFIVVLITIIFGLSFMALWLTMPIITVYNLIFFWI